MTINKMKSFAEMKNHSSSQMTTYNFKNVSKSVTGNFWNVYICIGKIWQNAFSKCFDFTKSASLHKIEKKEKDWRKKLSLSSNDRWLLGYAAYVKRRKVLKL